MASHKPYCIKVEPVRGCTRRCAFCSLSTIEWKDAPYEYMPLPLFAALCRELARWVPKHRMEFEGRGEPSLHPQLLEMVAIARYHLPQAQLTIDTNTDYLKKCAEPAEFVAWVEALFAAGMNHVVLDCYDRKRFALMRELFPDAVLYFEGAKHQITPKSPWVYWGANQRQVYVVESVPGNVDRTREITNHAGNLDLKHAEKMGYYLAQSVEEQSGKMCVRPFRDLVVEYDGGVPLCCLDWRGEHRIGKFPEQTLEELWWAMDPWRWNLVNRDRTKQAPCNACNIRAGSRVGFELGWFEDRPVPTMPAHILEARGPANAAALVQLQLPE